MGRLWWGLDWEGNRGTLGKNSCEVSLRQRTVQTSGTGWERFDRIVSEDFRHAVSSFLCCLLRGVTLFCGTNKPRNNIRNCLNHFSQTHSSVGTTIIIELVTSTCGFYLVLHVLSVMPSLHSVQAASLCITNYICHLSPRPVLCETEHHMRNKRCLIRIQIAQTYWRVIFSSESCTCFLMTHRTGITRKPIIWWPPDFTWT